MLRVRAFAKINLSLQVVGRRADGYHELRTVFQTIALHDTLTFRRIGGRAPFALSCSDPRCPADDGNLVWKAAALAWRASGRTGKPRGMVVDLRKRIPLEAGLGGGSADAAAALRAFKQMWRVKEGEVRRIAARLGADVPFFLEGGTALGLDRGDTLFRLADAPSQWVVLALPPFGVSTREAYAWLDARPPTRDRTASTLPNDLQAPVAGHFPVVNTLARQLSAAGASLAAMSGSGSTVFGLFDTRRGAIAAGKRLQRAHPEVRCAVTRTVARAEHERRSVPYV